MPYCNLNYRGEILSTVRMAFFQCSAAKFSIFSNAIGFMKYFAEN